MMSDQRHTNAYWSLICDFIIDRPDFDTKALFYISKNPNVTWKIICTYPNGAEGRFRQSGWVWGGIALNPNITAQILRDYPDGPPGAKFWRWDWETISTRIPIKIMEEYDDLPWCNYSILSNPSLTIDYLIKLKNICSSNKIVIGPLIKWEDICKHPNFNWDMNSLHNHPKIDPEIIKQIVDAKDFICNQSESHYNPFTCMAQDPNLTDKHFTNMEHYKYPNSSLVILYKYYFGNPNVNPKFIRDTINNNVNFKFDVYDVHDVAKNPMNGHYWATNVDHHKHLATTLALTIRDELMVAAMHPRRHPGCWMSIDELKDHPLLNYSPDEIREIYDDIQVEKIKSGKIQL